MGPTEKNTIVIVQLACYENVEGQNGKRKFFFGNAKRWCVVVKVVVGA